MLIDKYKYFAKENHYIPDENQLKLVQRLDAFIKIINSNFIDKFKEVLNPHEIRGMYIWGGVGRGKSVLLKLFYECLSTKHKKWQHFHAFMLEVHIKLKELWGIKNPIQKLAKRMAKEYKVIVLDELQINNIADAMVFGRLFKTLINKGVYVFFTSNRTPSDLFFEGLKRELFMPFIESIQSRLEVFNLDNLIDYRIENGMLTNKYLCPINKKNQEAFDDILKQLTGNHVLKEALIKVNEARSFRLLQTYGNIVVCTFDELCVANMGASDYFALCNQYNLLMIKNIPKLTKEYYNEALRFITLIDCVYEKKTKLICLAEASINDIYAAGINSFEFQRTASRLKEITSNSYYN